MERAWRALRALFVVFHVVAVSVAAFPSVGNAGLNRDAWKQPTVQGEFRAWAGRLGALGVHLTPTELEDRLWTIATTTEGVRQDILTPFQPYYRYCGTWQSWKMFVAPHRYPSRLEILLDRGEGRFEPLYVADSSEYDWHATWFHHDRMRAAVFRYGWDHFRPWRKQFADWVARVAADEFPDARLVRVQFVHYRTPSPEEVLAGAPVEMGETMSQTRRLSDFRGAR
ncbi:MAG: hypothetical protein H6735_01640 [Alphaproteobacteria bacterium]|nr:hypothetical protein [Alphaproteobacteria bacterium]